MPNIKLISGHLGKHSSGHLKLWSNPTWHTASTTTTGWGGYNWVNPAATKTNINQDPLSTAYPTAKAAALAAFAAGTSRTTYGNAAVGASYGAGGAARSEVSVGGTVLSFTPAAVCSSARLAASAVCQVGVFNASPSGASILAAMEFTPSGGYVNLDIFLDIINDCAANATTCFVSACRQPPASMTGSIDQQSYYNDTGAAFNMWGWCPVAIGETLYWKTGSGSSFSYPLTAGSVGLYY